jgi:hypothetical protein
MGIGHIVLLNQDYNFGKIRVLISLHAAIFNNYMKETDSDWNSNTASPPANFSPYLKSLWWDLQGNWNKAHEEIQDVEGPDAAWIHAYLHRKEGDIWNADYWYKRAARKRPSCSLEEEWASLKKYFIEQKIDN